MRLSIRISISAHTSATPGEPHAERSSRHVLHTYQAAAGAPARKQQTQTNSESQTPSDNRTATEHLSTPHKQTQNNQEPFKHVNTDCSGAHHCSPTKPAAHCPRAGRNTGPALQTTRPFQTQRRRGCRSCSCSEAKRCRCMQRPSLRRATQIER